MLRNELRSAIPTNQRGRMSQGVPVTQLAHPHMAHITIHTIQKPNWEVIEHPVHSPFRFAFIWTPQELQEVFNLQMMIR